LLPSTLASSIKSPKAFKNSLVYEPGLDDTKISLLRSLLNSSAAALSFALPFSTLLASKSLDLSFILLNTSSNVALSDFISKDNTPTFPFGLLIIA
jgi:hypothetical protein